MNSTSQTPIAEAADQRWYLLAVMVFLLGLRSAIAAGMVLVDQPYRATWAGPKRLLRCRPLRSSCCSLSSSS